jgi:hypothetical protein
MSPEVNPSYSFLNFQNNFFLVKKKKKPRGVAIVFSFPCVRDPPRQFCSSGFYSQGTGSWFLRTVI